MAARENVTAAELRTCILKNLNIINLVRTVTIRESICSSFLTGELIVLDNARYIQDLELMGGDPCIISFRPPMGGKSYDVDMYVLDAKGESSPENMNLKVYTISLVSSEYFTDRGNTTSKSSELGQTGCSLVQAIWGECGFQTPLVQDITDMPLRDGQQPFHVDHVKPFTAIGQIRDIQVYPDQTGNVLLYRNVEGTTHVVHHVPLHYIYTTPSSLETFLQRETWGIDPSHPFGGDGAFQAIIDIKEHSRATMLDKDAFRTQTKRATDLFAAKFMLNMFQGLLGAGQNYASTNSNRTSTPIDFTNVMDKARCYAHCLKSQPQYLVRVPLQSGINITAGKWCRLELLPPRESPNSPNQHTGFYLVTDLIHEVHRDLRLVNGTTVFNALLTGANCGV